MKIVPIFAESLYSFHYAEEEENELDRLLNLWSNAEYLYNYAKINNQSDPNSFVLDVTKNLDQVIDLLNDLNDNNESFTKYFEPLSISEWNQALPRQKGKIKNNSLRIYALKVEANCFVITGGAIKMGQKMQDHPDTQKELDKLKAAQNYLKEKGVFDTDSFHEFIFE